MNRVLTYIVLGLLLFSSCHSSKNVVSDKDLKQFEITALYDSITKHYGDFNTVKFSFALDVKGAKAIPQIKGNIRIKKDSIVWLGVSAMNIDVFRAVLTQDSVKFYSKLQKTYFGGPLDSISNITSLSIDYKTIEAILLDELFLCTQGQRVDTVELFKSFDINKKDNKIVLKSHSKKEFKKNDTIPLLQTWQIANSNLRIHEVEIVEENAKLDNEKVKIKLTYSDFETIQNISFPLNLSVKAKLPTKKINCDLRYSKVIFNDKLSFPFNNPDKYQKVDLK
ncbi:MAG: DUF4292 domain-containing protein [Bacteroidales bacterium]|nr:DUF4292 domain-containing protein [Bacteroidales bacterium]